VTAFLLDPAPDKRERVVRDLLADPQYGQNWSRYWRDVIFSRKLEDRAQVAANALVADLTERLNENVPWDKIATEFITATGDVKENGAAAIHMAQDGRTEETTAEISRIFLGIQIQCAQCHDHKFDRWTRDQFHQLAAFFPRTGVQPVQTPTRNSFQVVVNDRPQPARRGNPNNTNRRGAPEHYMPDLERPDAQGELMTPQFFLTDEKLPLGTTDAVRRGTLAKWLTENPWFAMALVNRLWGELVGEGFYEPIDDMGPDRTPSGKKAVEFLSLSFAESGYDVKWLFRTICATDAYQRESRPRRNTTGTPFAANVAQPLRSDQVYNALLTATGGEEVAPAGRGRRAGRGAARRGRGMGPRPQFDAVFGFDPSDPRETVASSIPQALAMMNAPGINQTVRGQNRATTLGEMIAQIPNDEALIAELYLRTLSREPTDKEMQNALAFRRTVAQRPQAFEDLYWALLNTSEFSHRR
jgi:hypothetical protein